ncbi:MAG: hypothetical protein Q7T97_10110 [Burkholderiaceae bacterium]|nr:hypothetical protein [Burkholderiaceae bacterium]
MSVALSEARSRTTSPIVLDIEASGFGRDSYPIEIGYVLPDGGSYCTLVRPEANWTHWDPEAQRLHHIARATAVQHGRPPIDIARHLNYALFGQTVYSDGWANDYSWLGTLFDAAELSPSFHIENLRALLSEAEAENWHAIKDQVSRELNLRRHRASSDARLLQMTLMRLRAPMQPR